MIAIMQLLLIVYSNRQFSFDSLNESKITHFLNSNGFLMHINELSIINSAHMSKQYVIRF